LYPAVRPHLDAALAEGLFVRYDFAARRYRKVRPGSDAARVRERFLALRRSGLRVLTIEYAPPDATDLVRYAIAAARRAGFDVYVATIDLQTVRRDVLAFEAAP
ncbi:MAG: hypothetical protein D6776_07830, partial [Planctomycetota bacterium]